MSMGWEGPLLCLPRGYSDPCRGRSLADWHSGHDVLGLVSESQYLIQKDDRGR